MNTYFFPKAAALGLLLLTAPSAPAQNPANGGFWVTESNTKPARITLVHYYDAQHRRMQTDTARGRCLNIHRRRVVQSLNRSLRTVGEQWALRQAASPAEPLAQQRQR